MHCVRSLMEGEDKILTPQQRPGKQDAFPVVRDLGSESMYRTKPGRSEIMKSEEKWRKEQ